MDTIIVTSLFNSTICIIWQRALSICTTFFLISSFAPWRNPSIVLLYKSIHFLKGYSTVHHIYSQLNSQPRTTCMPCSKPIWRKYSKNEVILPSDRWGSMACHAVPRVMMYQGDARVPLEAEAILVRGLR